MIAEARPAACLILMRDRAGAPPEMLIVRRGAALAFAGGAYAFPGGRVDEADRLAGTRLAIGDADDAAARVAAIRETIEETGIWAAVDPLPADPPQHRAAGLSRWLDNANARILPEHLTPFARWLPAGDAPRRFDTRFYLADAGLVPKQSPVADGTETESAFWASAADVLASADRGDGRVIYPTRRILERLARFASLGDARAEAETMPPRIITPWIEEHPDGRWMCIPTDAGYPICREALETASRH